MSAYPFRSSLSTQFWIFQLTGWSTWVVLLVLRDLSFVPAEYIATRAAIFAIDALVGMLLTTLLRFSYRMVWEYPAPVRIATVVFGSFFASLVWLAVKTFITSTDVGSAVDLRDYGLVTLIVLFPFSYAFMLVWSVLYFCIKYYQLFQLEKTKVLRSEALAHEVQLRMLRYQLNPHFLFNTLNAISTLVLQQDTKSANSMLTKLSLFLRYSLDNDPLEQVPLQHELSSVKLYLDIEKVRFEERMKIELEIAPEAEQARVPSMLLQPLIENSIKHAIARSEEGGCISIRARVEAGRLIIQVEDDGPGICDPEVLEANARRSGGVGLKNIRNRLKEIYGAAHSLAFSSGPMRGCLVTVVIPYETK
ncbi:MAG: histidine kinase [Pseudomonadales bacterium]|nr:histidine kinase [Pseudomonadales bacterium]MCP5358579.1 histidine kinase [Pseudomonadales bacterium]